MCFVDYEQTEDASADNSTVKLKVGDTVQFTGNKHYGSSDSTEALKATPGSAQITLIEEGAHTPTTLFTLTTTVAPSMGGWMPVPSPRHNAATRCSLRLI